MRAIRIKEDISKSVVQLKKRAIFYKEMSFKSIDPGIYLLGLLSEFLKKYPWLRNSLDEIKHQTVISKYTNPTSDNTCYIAGGV